MDIPVFHDDQHGTAVVVLAALINSCFLTNWKIEDLKIVINGAGAAGISCLDLMIHYGVKIGNILTVDSKGVIYRGWKEGMNEFKERFAQGTSKRTLDEALENADVFIGVSVKDALKPSSLLKMNKSPIIFALANPDPEITYDLAK